MRFPPGLYIAAVCFIEVLSMMAFATFPTLIPTFQSEWGISNTEAGWISGVYFVGYVAAVAILTALTDRIDAKRIYIASLLLGACSALGFAVAASGLWSASCWRLLQGIAVAGTYMPGLKALTDVLPARLVSRGTAFYTSSFGIGASLSYYFSGLYGEALGWQWAFGLCAAGPAVALVFAALVLRSRPPEHHPSTRLLDFRPVLANRSALGFTLAYSVHNAELFAFRSWIVAFLVFSQSYQQPGALALALSAATTAALLNLTGLPASVLGNELAARAGRQRTIIGVMSLSALLAFTFGFLAPAPFWLVLAAAFVYMVTINGESATLTAGVVTAAEPRYKGATMAVHSVIGFSGAIVGPIAFGAVLDLAGGGDSRLAWGLAFGAMGILVLLGPLAILRLVGVRRHIF